MSESTNEKLRRLVSYYGAATVAGACGISRKTLANWQADSKRPGRIGDAIVNALDLIMCGLAPNAGKRLIAQLVRDNTKKTLD